MTSPLVPWNTCGAYMSGVLGVSTASYLPFCFFNLLSPVLDVLYGFLGFKVATIDEVAARQEQAGAQPEEEAPGDDDRAALGVALLRRRLRPRRGCVRRSGAGFGPRERRALRALARERCVGQGPGRRPGRQAAAGRRRGRARAMDARAEVLVPPARGGRPLRPGDAARARAAADASRVPARRDRCRARGIGAARARRAQAAGALHDRWVHGRAHGDADRVRGHAHDRGRVRGGGPGVGRGARARAVRSPRDVRGARVEGARPVRRSALRRDRCRHQLGQVPRRRARCGRRLPARRRPGRGHPAGRGARADGTARRGADRAHRRRDRGHGRRRRPPGGGGPRRGRHRRAAHRAQRGRAPRRRARHAPASRSR